MDVKRFVLLWKKNCITMFAAMLLGIVLGGVIYHIYYLQATKVPVYETESIFYITANEASVYNYFNSYTWADEIRKAPILDRAYEALLQEHPDTNITKDDMKNSVSADIMSDLRIVTVWIRTDQEETSRQISMAIAEGMVGFAEYVHEFDSIELWSVEETELVKKDYLIGHAMILGCIVAIVLWWICYSLFYAMDDMICVERDVTGITDIPVLGYDTKKKDPFFSELLEMNKNRIFDGKTIDRSSIGDEQWCTTLKNRQGDKIILEVPFHKMNRKMLELALSECRKNEVFVSGIVITEADDRFLQQYYGIKKRK